MSPVAPMPEVGRLASLAYEGMKPLADTPTGKIRKTDAERGYPLLKFLHAYYLPMQQVDDIVRDRPDEGLPGWAILFHPDYCPPRYLPWLAMVTGVRLKSGMPDAEIRQRIKERDGLKRCTPAALITAAQSQLTGARSVLLRERYNHEDADADSPGYFQVITYSAETPDPDAVRAALLEQKDVGLIMDYQVRGGQDWQKLIDDHATWSDVLNTYATWQDVVDDEPI